MNSELAILPSSFVLFSSLESLREGKPILLHRSPLSLYLSLSLFSPLLGTFRSLQNFFIVLVISSSFIFLFVSASLSSFPFASNKLVGLVAGE
ncbi:unnamed protein product [Prunus brigantina]